MIKAEEVDEDDYLSDLSQRNRERFKEEYKDNFKDTDIEAIKTNLRQQYYERAEPHNELLRGAAGAFHPKMGSISDEDMFYFSSVTPLSAIGEVNEPSVDIMLVKHEHNGVYLCAICCEVRNSTSKWVENIDIAHQKISNNLSRIKEQFGAPTRGISDIQYVTLLDADEAMGVNVSDLERNCDPENYALWEMDTDDWWVTHKGGTLCHPKLRSTMSKKIDVLIENPLSYAVGAHPIIPLEKISYNIVREKLEFDDDSPEEFTESTFENHYEENLQVKCSDDTKSEIIEKEVKRLLEEGLNMGFLTEDGLDNAERDYGMVFSGPRKPDQAENGVEDQYFNNMPKYEAAVQAFRETKDEFDPDRTIGDYG